jgi:hypothetical protein
MAIYLPFGIAFFQLNIAQIHGLSSEQNKLLSGWSSPELEPRPNAMTLIPHPCGRTPEPRGRVRGVRGLKIWWKRMTSVQRTEFLIGIAMAAQVCFLWSS